MSELNQARTEIESEKNVLEVEEHDGMLMVAVNTMFRDHSNVYMIGKEHGLSEAGFIDDDAQIEEVGAPKTTDAIVVLA